MMAIGFVEGDARDVDLMTAEVAVTISSPGPP